MDRPTSRKLAKLAAILFAHVRTGLGSPWPKDTWVLFDLGASSSIISYELVQNLCLMNVPRVCGYSQYEPNSKS